MGLLKLSSGFVGICIYPYYRLAWAGWPFSLSILQDIAVYCRITQT